MKNSLLILLLLPLFSTAQNFSDITKVSDSVPKILAKGISARMGDSIGVRTVNSPGDTCCWIGRYSIADKANKSDSGRGVVLHVTGYDLNKVRDSVQANVTTLTTTVSSKLNTANPVATGIATFPSIKYGRRAVADVNATLATSDYLLAFTSMSAARTVTLPAASTAPNQFFIIKDESGSASIINFISLIGTVDGGVNPTIITIGRGVYRLYSNGTNWYTW
jgi:hypothetical protein